MPNKERFAHDIRLRVFHNQSKDTEDKEELKKKLEQLTYLDIEKEKIKLLEDKATGVLDNEIDIYTISLKNNRHINNFIREFFSKLDDNQLELLKDQLESRLDERLNFFIRLEKQDFLEDKITITDSGNCFHIRINLAVFPARREKAKEKIEKLLNRDMEI